MLRGRPLLLVLALAAPLGAAPPRDRIDPWIDAQLARAAPGARVGVLVELAARPDLSAVRGTKEAKGRAVYRALAASARQAQAPLLARLDELGVPYRSFWIANLVRLDADAALIAELGGRDDVLRLVGDAPLRVPVDPVDTAELAAVEAPAAIEWNVTKINADDVWALGFRGESAVVAGQDTGYQWNHPALVGKYRGWNGASADHAYNWHDAIHGNNPNTPAGNPCGFDLAAPCDDDSHGTHTMGTMVGDDGGSHQIGVAPGAQWIACRNMEEGWGTPTTYLECFQWFLAPTDLAGQNPDPAKAPDAINNSWSCPAVEGCNSGNFATMRTAVENLRAAGVAVVASAGNGGSACSTINAPAAMFDAAIAVANTTSSDTIAGTSSRGPVTVDGSNRMKPDLSAPGTSVYSSVPTNGYGTKSGTSMAGPHVAAAIALLVSAQPALRGDVDTLESLLEANALPLTTTQGCGGDTASQVPNNVYGWGRIDAAAAVEDALALDLLTVDDYEVASFARWDLVCPGGPGCL